VRRLLIPAIAVAVVAAACGGGEMGGSSTGSATPVTTVAPLTPATTSTSTTASSSTVAPPTSLTSTTTTAIRMAGWSETWFAVYRRHFPGYAIEFVEVTSGERIILPTDRRQPYPEAVFSDGRGGLLISEPPGHLAAGELHSVAFGEEDAWLRAVATIDGNVTALSVLLDGTSAWEGLEIITDTDITLLAQPVGRDAVVVLRTHVSSHIDHQTGNGEQEGEWLSQVAYGGGILGIVWTRLGQCSRLELRAGLTAAPAPFVNPWPDERCYDTYGGLLDIALTTDGRFLAAMVFPSVEPTLGGPDLVLWDLSTGEEIDRLPGVMHFHHDGDRGIAADRRVNGTDHPEVALVRITDTGLEITERPDLQAGGLGLIAGPLTIAKDATLAPAEPWTDCSRAGAAPPAEQLGLSEAATATRTAIANAIRSCDLEALADVAINSAGFAMADGNVTCDEPWPMSVNESDPFGIWYRGDVDNEELRVMLDTLNRPFTRDDDRYAWEDEHGYRIEIGTDGTWLLDWRQFPQALCEGMDCDC